ncbi:mitochondrial basic amino acids transporter-related [Holotrichia oblita]|uniref:Mitochondrial basic amino acids transporter-related n=1 Tax=Holotrichia oblita TaxID=644536 RepID=A0ACB9T194_HOLOL|nr:mitochondrial basic amino acids transporter-related [Holotrichia oblita]
MIFLLIPGCAGVIVGHPLDTIKVHLQTQNTKNPRYNGAYQCFKYLVAKDGVRGLYRGISSPLSGVAAINAVVFGVYGNTRRIQNNPDALTSCMVAGAASGICQSFFNSPMELVKIRMQVSGDNRSAIAVAKEIYNLEGFKGVFRGLNITIAREIPAFVTYFATYECLTRTSDNSPVSTMTMLVAGGTAGVVSWLISYPVDIIKSRMQMDGMNGSRMYKNGLDCVRKSVAVEGYSFLFRGLAPTLVRAFPVNASCFAVVTWTMRLFNEMPAIESSGASVWDNFLQNSQPAETSTLLLQ